MSRTRRIFVVVLQMAIAAWPSDRCTSATAAEKDQTVKRARPPTWPADVLDAFFGDARDKLVGERPDVESRGFTPASAGNAPTNASANDASKTATSWAALIDAATIETEIKRIAQAVEQDVTTPSEFKGGKYQECRRHFSMLATLFALAAEYDDTVRWHDSAAGLRDLFSRAGRNCKVGTDQTFREATERKQDLADLIRGSRPQVPPAEREANWAQIADRPPLMQRLNIALEERITKWLASEREFSQHRDEVLHEAQLTAAIAEVIGREGFEYWDDEEYASYARELKQAATDVAAATQQENLEQARAAGAQMTKACANCHEGYRG